jgi:hypothetical protein
VATSDEETIRLARELIYYGGHGYTGSNAHRYPILLALPQLIGRLPASATADETAIHIDNVLIESIRQYRLPVTLPFSEIQVSVESVRDHWTKLLGLPPYYRASKLKDHRMEVSDAVGGGALSTWRRPGGNEEQYMRFLADHLLSPPGPLGGGSWVVRQSRLHYFLGEDQSIKRLECRYDAETLRDGVTMFGVDHRSGTERSAAEYSLVEESLIGCDGYMSKRLDDKTLSLDLTFDEPLPKGDRRTVGYDLGVSTHKEGIQRLRLNAAVLVWDHQLEVTYTEGVLPQRIWWFAHHVGTGAGQEPDEEDRGFDLYPSDLTVHQSFAGLRQGPDYGIAFRWDERGSVSDVVTSVGQ